MKIFNWFIDRHLISGLFIVSIICAIMSLVMICHIFFNFSLSGKLGRLSMEYHKGIAVPVKFSATPGGDTSILVRKMIDNSNSRNTIFRQDIQGKWLPVEGMSQTDITNAEDVIYRDTISPAYQTMNSRPP